MARSKDYAKSIFCLETEWSEDFSAQIGVSSILQFLKSVAEIDYIHRRCATIGELKYYLNRLHEYPDYGLIYLAFHGSSNSIWIEENALTLSEIADLCNGAFRNKIIHFGSCRTIHLAEWKINDFIQKSEALLVSGYTKNVDFVPSAAFDILFFEICQHYKDTKAMEKYIANNYQSLIDLLGFKIFHR